MIEEFLEGEIGSLFALCDGKTAMLFGWAQDHKRAFDGEQGPNTGGMGTYSPAPVFTPELVEQVARAPGGADLRRHRRRRGAVSRGALRRADGHRQGPKLVEFNARFGDPECQVLMLRLESDLVPYLLACATGRSPACRRRTGSTRRRSAWCWRPRAIPRRRPRAARSAAREADFGADVAVFHAGTKRDEDGALRAAGGRVLNVCARGADLARRATGPTPPSTRSTPRRLLPPRHRLARARNLSRTFRAGSGGALSSQTRVRGNAMSEAQNAPARAAAGTAPARPRAPRPWSRRCVRQAWAGAFWASDMAFPLTRV